MRLKSLKLAGFKSFANPTTFSFKHDITAIVGPNGCGKSNVIDAIRWVLGETSAKQLRGGAMSDVIFAGVEGRAGKSMASVELTFEHTQDENTGIRHALNLYHELTLRRQVSKDGKSDYFINGQRVRRRDVVDVFLGTGLGARSYAVIEQGMIGRIIDADGQRLREFIEEAAGVSRYQVRRDETEKQLKKAQENLERLNGLQSELSKQHKTLQRQAASAQRYQDIQSQLHTVEIDILTHRLYNAWQQHESFKSTHETTTQKLNELTQSMSALRTHWDDLAAKLAQVQWQRDEARAHAHSADLAQQSAQHALDAATLSHAQTTDALAKLKSDTQALKDDDDKRKQSIDTHQQAITQLTPKLAQLNTELSALKNEQFAITQDWQDARQALNALYNERQQYQNTLNLNASASQRLSQQRARLAQKQANYDAQAKNLNQNPCDDAALSDLRARLDSLNAQISERESLLEERRPQLNKLSDSLNASRNQISELDKQHSRLASEYDTLHKLVYPPKPSAPATHTTASTALPKLSTIADTLSLSTEGKAHADILDKALAALLSDGVLTNNKDALEHFFAHTPDAKDSQKALWLSGTISTQHKAPAGLIPLSRLISAPRLPLWQVLYLSTDTTTDTVDWQHPDYAHIAAIITPTGWLLHRYGAWHVSKFGADMGAGFLVQRQAHLARLAELEDALGDLEDEMDTLKHTHKAEQGEHDTLKVDIEEYSAQLAAMQHDAQATERALMKLESAQALSAHTQAQLAQTHALLVSETQELQAEAAQLAEEKARAETALEALTPDLNQGKSRLDALSQSQDAIATRSRELQAEIQQLTLTLQSHQSASAHTQAHMREMADMQTRLDAEQQHLTALLAKLDVELPTLTAAAKSAQQDAHTAKLACDEYDAMQNTIAHEQAQVQATRTSTQDAIDAQMATQARLGADAAMALARVQELGLQLGERVENFNLTSRLSDFAHANFQLTGNLDALTRSQKQLASDLSKLGAVNLAAAAELAELEARLTPMLTEIADVEASIVTLQQAIDTINQKTKALFLATLQAVNEDLGKLFAKVFGGGQASLSLTDDDSLAKADKWRAGLVLMAQPRGKKNSRLAVLSGGEKTLTALSLIFAIFKQNPAPFCVLDEVDAPLDDANVGRFTGLIGELARDVQFIFISHNKLAMQSAQELKGVTMPTAGISSLVSVSLAEAAELVA